MALDPADLTALSNAIQTAIANGFATAFPTGPPTSPGPSPGGGGSPGSPTPGAPPTGPTPVPTPAAPASASALATAGGATYAGATTGALEKTFDTVAASEKAASAAFSEVAKLSESLYVKGYRDLIQDFGGEIRKISQEDFIRGNFEEVANKGSEAAIRSYRNMALGYAKELNYFEGLSLEQQERNRKELVKSFGDTNANLLIGSNKTLEKHLQMFKTSMNIEMSEAAELISVSFAETGKVSDQILTEITNNAASVGKAVGVSTKIMAEGIREVKTDMETFTDITVASAARIVGVLSQVGLSLSSFEKILGDYRGFDSAAEKMGELSATFGIQMDAMEMMYLANEDEEQFLLRMREQILDQGIDIESMSKTRQRALASQMGMSVKEMKQFLNTGMMVTDQTELQAATQEASTKTQADAVAALEVGLVKSTKTMEEMKAETQELQSAFSALSISNFVESVGLGQKEFQKFQTTGNKIAETIVTVQGTIASLTSQLSTSFTGVLQAINPSSSEAEVQAGWKAITNTFVSEGELSITQMATGVAYAIQKSDLFHNSWPEAFKSLASAFGSDLDGNPNDQMVFYQDTIKQWGDTITLSIQEALENINSSFDFSEVSLNFQKAASIVTDGVQILSSPTPITVSTKPVAAAASESSSLKTVTASIQSISEKIQSMPTEVNVKVDVESIKKDIINAITSGFNEANYGFNMFVDREQIATVISKSTTSGGKTFSMVAPS